MAFSDENIFLEKPVVCEIPVDKSIYVYISEEMKPFCSCCMYYLV